MICNVALNERKIFEPNSSFLESNLAKKSGPDIIVRMTDNFNGVGVNLKIKDNNQYSTQRKEKTRSKHSWRWN
jgi:hypothetical protein